jgi:hypothetical protein
MTSDHERIDLLLEELGEQAIKHRTLIYELKGLAEEYPELAATIRLMIAEYS